MAVKIGDVTIRIGASTKELEADLRKAERALQATSRKFTNIGQSLTLGLTVPMLGVGAAATSSFAEIERLQNSLTAVMGDAKAAGEEFERLRKVAEAPGLALPQVVSASAKLQAVGLSAEEARDTISQYGNAVARSGGQAQEFDGAILALTQIASKGKISAEELNQLGERIFEIRPALEAAFGTSNSEELQKLGISAEEFIAKTTTELGKLERVQGGLSNAFENFRDNITSALSTLGDSISSAIDLPSLLDRISGAVAKVGEFFKNLSPETQKTIVYFGLFVAAIGPLLIVFGKLSLAIGTIRIAMIGLQAAFTQGGLLAAFSFLGGPAIVGVAALAAAAYLLYKNWEVVKKSLVDVVNYFIDLYNESTLFRAAINSIILAFKGFVNAGQLAISLVINAFKSLFKFIVDGFRTAGKLIKAVITLDTEAIPGIIKEGFSAFGNIGDFVKDSAKDLKVFGVQTSVDLADAVNDTLRKRIKPITGEDLFGGGAAAGKASTTQTGVTPTGDFERKSTSKISDSFQKELAKIEEELANLDKFFAAGLIEPAELASQKIKLLEDKLKLLVINGFDATSPAVIGLKDQISELQKSIPPTFSILNPDQIIPEINAVTFEIAKLQNAFEVGLISQADLYQGKISLLTSELQKLSDQGFSASSEEVTNLKGQITALNDEQNKIITTTQTYLQLIGLLPGQFNVFTQKISEAQAKVQAFTKATSDAINGQLNQAIVGGLEAVGTMIGNLISGEGAGSLKVFFNSILTVILDFAIGLGKQLIALGTATESLKKLFTNPIGAIIAGVGLIAVATIVKGIISKGVPSLAIGTDMVKSDGLAMIHKGEAIVPADVAKGGFNGGNGTQIYGRLSGIDLLLSNDYAKTYQSRLR